MGADHGLDIAKSVFQVHGVDVDGTVVMQKRISRAKLLEGSLIRGNARECSPGGRAE